MHDMTTHIHTCSELSLRILLWNASYVQKTLQLHLTGMGRWREPTKYQEATIAIASAEWNKLEADPSPSTKPYRSYLDRLRKPYRNWNGHLEKQKLQKFKTDVMPVLGLAGRHEQKTDLSKLQVRLDGQSRFPTLWPSLVELGQSQSAQLPCPVPLLKLNESRQLASLQMFHTHSPLPRDFFGRCIANAHDISGQLGSDRLIKMPDTVENNTVTGWLDHLHPKRSPLGLLHGLGH